MTDIRSRIVGLHMIDPSRLKANPKNWRRHPASQISALRTMLERIGYVSPVIVRRISDGEFEIIDGHARTGISETDASEVPVIEVDLTQAEVDQVLASLDPLAAMAGSDAEALARLMPSDKEMAALFENIWKGADLREALNINQNANSKDAEPQTDRAAELQMKWGTELGQLWRIGAHRLLCGNSTVRENVERVMGGECPHLCVTDPPYGVDYDPAWRSVEAAKGRLAYAARRVGPVENDDRADWSDAWRLFPGDVIYSWHPVGALSLVHAAALQASGFDIRMQIIWAKSNFPIGRGDYHIRHESCWYTVRKGKPSFRTDDRTQTTLWEINLDKNIDGGHSTQKPLECMARPIRNHVGDVYDPFLGSGTTMVAAQNLSRRCFALEIAPRYVAVALERMATAFPGIDVEMMGSEA